MYQPNDSSQIITVRARLRFFRSADPSRIAAEHDHVGEHDGGEFAFFGVSAHCRGSVTLNWILASCSGARPILRRKGSQRGSEWILSNRFSAAMLISPGS